MIRALLLAFILFTSALLHSQPYSAFTDLQQKFYLFDNGVKQNIENLPPVSYKVGRNALMYLNNLRVLKVYKDGVLSKVNDYYTSDYGVTDNLIYYLTSKTLSVIDNDNEVKELTRLVGDYQIGDSIILYYDHVRNLFNAYYNYEVFELENYLATQSVKDFKASDNIGAYMNYTGNFKIFWHGQCETVETQPVQEYFVGRNTVAYIDYNDQFKIFQNGQVYSIDGFKPKSYKVGDNVVAYQTFDGYFKIFYDGQELNVGYYQNDFEVHDNVVVFKDGNNFLQLFYRGNFLKVDNYYPSKFLAAYNSFAYIDRANTLRFFDGKQFNNVSNMVNDLDQVSLNYDVLTYKIGLNMFRFFCNGKDFD